MTVRQSVQQLLRSLGLLPLADVLRYHLQRLRMGAENSAFRAAHPGFPTPPLHLLYEIGGRIRLPAYFEEGRESSAFLAGKARSWLPAGPVAVLDWGCGVACVVRHMPGHFPTGSHIFGSDYNAAMIAWAKPAVPVVTFSANQLLPPLSFHDQSLNWIYGLSVVTHLSDEALKAWLDEFHRILKPGGLLTLTTNGSGCEGLFSPAELAAYQNTGYVIRGGLDEGRKMFLAYHLPEYFRRTVSADWEVLEFVPKGMPITGQDLWWLRAR